MTNGRGKEETGVQEDGNEQLTSNGRPLRSSRGRAVNGTDGHLDGSNPIDEMDEESDAPSSGDEWNGGDDNANEDVDDDKISEDESADEQPSLVVQLRYPKGKVSSSPIPPGENDPSTDTKIPETKPTEQMEPVVKPPDTVPAVGEMELDNVPEKPVSPPDPSTAIATNGVEATQNASASGETVL